MYLAFCILWVMYTFFSLNTIFTLDGLLYGYQLFYCISCMPYRAGFSIYWYEKLHKTYLQPKLEMAQTPNFPGCCRLDKWRRHWWDGHDAKIATIGCFNSSQHQIPAAGRNMATEVALTEITTLKVGRRLLLLSGLGGNGHSTLHTWIPLKLLYSSSTNAKVWECYYVCAHYHIRNSSLLLIWT